MLAARGLLLAITDEGATTYLVAKDSFFAALGQGELLGVGVPVWITAGAVRRRRGRCCVAPASASACTRSAATRTRPR